MFHSTPNLNLVEPYAVFTSHLVSSELDLNGLDRVRCSVQSNTLQNIHSTFIILRVQLRWGEMRCHEIIQSDDPNAATQQVVRPVASYERHFRDSRRVQTSDVILTSWGVSAMMTSCCRWRHLLLSAAAADCRSTYWAQTPQHLLHTPANYITT